MSSRQKVSRNASYDNSASKVLHCTLPPTPWCSKATSSPETKSKSHGKEKNNKSNPRKNKKNDFMMAVPNMASTYEDLFVDAVPYKMSQSKQLAAPKATASLTSAFADLAKDISKSIGSSVNNALHSILDTQMKSSPATSSEADKLITHISKTRLEKEAELVNLTSSLAVSSTIERVQDERKRMQIENEIHTRKELIQLDHLEAMNKAKVREFEAASAHARQMEMVKLTTSSQIGLMETTSNCNRGQAIFNSFGNNESSSSSDNE